MGARNLVDLDLQRGQPQSSLAGAVAGDVTCSGERNVCLHLAFV